MMPNLYLSKIGRIFYGVSIAVMGFLTIYYRDFPYMLIPPKHSWIPSIVVIISGALLVLSGACIVFEKKIKPTSLLLGSVLLLIFCFYFIPYQLIASPNVAQFGDWENAAKELTLAGGAIVIAGTFSEMSKHPLFKFLEKLIPFGPILFSLTIISYGIDHFLYAKGAADYVPSWIPFHLLWVYLGGIGLLGSGIAIIIKVIPKLAATLLGSMIFIWFAILHIPRIIVSPSAYLGSEIASACLALAYCGIAFVIAAQIKNSRNLNSQ
ncbi:MAG TPA: hypothetical protein VGQ59_15430 [Cyclobacteriaceae bacterium]|jgi:uncharacterized membrane protein|nr:hypothetical protein [Cyclobacteriaceae bacterium]